MCSGGPTGWLTVGRNSSVKRFGQSPEGIRRTALSTTDPSQGEVFAGIHRQFHCAAGLLSMDVINMCAHSIVLRSDVYRYGQTTGPGGSMILPVRFPDPQS
jgi:hypothetical protein